jgi:hypothetical protein
MHVAHQHVGAVAEPLDVDDRRASPQRRLGRAQVGRPHLEAVEAVAERGRRPKSCGCVPRA